MRFVLKGGRIYSPQDGLDTIGDVWILDGVIESIYTDDMPRPSIPETATVIDCDGKWIAPGLVDVRTFCGELGVQHRETFDTLTTAAMAGGYTDLVLGPWGAPCVDNPCSRYRFVGSVCQTSDSVSCAGFINEWIGRRRDSRTRLDATGWDCWIV